MNKLIGLGLGAILLANQGTNNNNKKDNSRSNKKKRNLIENFSGEFPRLTAYFNNTTHYDQNIKSSSGFFYNYKNNWYFISTGHSIIYNWQNKDSIVADKITILFKDENYDINVKDCYYSKYFDVLVIPISATEYNLSYEDKVSYDEVKINESVIVTYLDPLSNKIVWKEPDYVNKIASNLHLGAIDHPLNAGSSGAPVLDNFGESFIGMVTSTDSEYQSMTLVVPIKTINRVIDCYLKNSNPKYLGVETNLINSAYTSAISNEILSELFKNNSYMGELIINSEDSSLRPFDIITSVNGEDVGNGQQRSINIALNYGIDNEPVDIQGFSISNDFIDKYCSYPRDLSNLIRNNILETVFITKFKFVENNKIVLDSSNNLEENTSIYLLNDKTKSVDSYIVKELKNNLVTLDRDLSDDNKLLEEATYYSSSNVYNTIIKTESISKGDIETTISLDIPLPFKFKNSLTEEQYKNLIITALFKNWCFLIIDFIKNKDYAIQFYVINKELDRFLKAAKEYLNNETLKTFYVEFVSKANEFLGPNCVNICNYFVAKIVTKQKYNKSLVNGIININKKFLPADLSKFESSLSDLSKIIANGSVSKEEVLKRLTFNSFTISNFQSEYYFKNSELANQTTIKSTSDYKLYAKNLELVYQEIESVKDADLPDDKLYQIKYYTNIKSYWDHAGYLLSHILQDPLLDYQPFEETIDQLSEIPKHLDTWQYNSVLARGGFNHCWITTYLHQENLLSDQDLQTFSNLTFYGLKNQKDFTQAYRSTFQATMDKFKQEASKDEWLDLQSWAHQILDQVKANQLEQAFQGFKNKVLQLTNQYNPDLQFDSIEALDSYFLAKENKN